jgi:TonB family protein
MPDHPRQDEDGGFRKTFVAIAVVHLVLLSGLLLASLYQPKQSNESVVWMSPGSFAGDSGAPPAPLAGNPDSTPPSDEEPKQPSQQETDPREEPASSPPIVTPQALPTPPPVAEESALPISTPTPSATPRPRPTPTSTPRSTPTPLAKSTPKPTPKPTPKAALKPTPKPSPTHSATPKSSPKSEVTPKEKPKIDASRKPKTSPLKSEEEVKANSSPEPSAREAEAGQGKGKLKRDKTTAGSGLQSRSPSGNGAGDGKVAGSGDSALAAYVGILSNRFQAAWNQPTSEMALGKTLKVTVKLKVEADGTVTEFMIAEGSGNAVVDDSVREAGKKITKLPPPPNGQAFSAPVRFELGN